MKVIENGDRKKLSEGRHYGVGFAFLKKSGEDFESIQAFTACKDYLNDVVYTEETGKSISVFGFTSKKCDLLKDGKAFLGMKIVSKNHGGAYSHQEEDNKKLAQNYKHIQALINWVEYKFNLGESSLLKMNDEGIVVITAPKYWATQTYLTSLYTLLLRLGLHYDGKLTPKQYLDGIEKWPTQVDKENLAPLDASLWKQALPNFKHLMSGGDFDVNYDDFKSNSYGIHNLGIVGVTKYAVKK